VPNNTPSASWKTRPNILGDVSGLSPEAIEALPAEERSGAVAPARREQVNRRHVPLAGSENQAMTLSERRPIRGTEVADGGRESTPVVEDHAVPVVPGNYPADLDSIIISTAELGRRSSRPPDHAAERQALLALARELAISPRGTLQKLAETPLRQENKLLIPASFSPVR
jgi:hypothetical protein